MDYIAPGSIDHSVKFNLDVAGASVPEFKINYERHNLSDGTSFTVSTPVALALLGSIITAHTDNAGTYMSAIADDGAKFSFRADFVDAAFATGASIVICNLYNDLNQIISKRIFTLEVDPALLLNYSGEKGVGVYLNASLSNTNIVPGLDGTQRKAVSTFAAAKSLADILGVKNIYCLGTTPVNAGLALGQAFVGYTFIGTEARGSFYVLLDSQDVGKSRFFGLGIYGVQGGTDKAECYDCVIADPGAGSTSILMDLYRCQLAEAFSVLAGLKHNWHDCYTVGEAGSGVAAAGVTIDLAAGGIDMAINNFHGGLTFSNATSAGRVRLNGSGSVGLAATNDNAFTLFLDGAWEFDDQKGTFTNLVTSGSYWNQFVRDSMQLAVTTGTGATGSIDEAIVDPIAEPAQGQPPVTPTLLESIQWRWANWRNKSTETATVQSIENDAGTVLAKRPTQSDDGVTFTNSKFVGGP